MAAKRRNIAGSKQRTTFPFNQNDVHQLKLEALLRASAACFNQKGFVGTSLRDVAAQLQVTDAALYYYVKSKEDLVFLCYERAVDLGEGCLRRAINEGSDAADRIKRFIKNCVSLAMGDEGPIPVVSELQALSAKYKNPLGSRLVEHARKVTSLIEQGIVEKTIEPCNARLACDILLGALAWIPKWHHGETPYLLEEVSESFSNTFMNGLLRR